jgi:hypothetical protein
MERDGLGWTAECFVSSRQNHESQSYPLLDLPDCRSAIETGHHFDLAQLPEMIGKEE